MATLTQSSQYYRKWHNVIACVSNHDNAEYEHNVNRDQVLVQCTCSNLFELRSQSRTFVIALSFGLLPTHNPTWRMARDIYKNAVKFNYNARCLPTF